VSSFFFLIYLGTIADLRRGGSYPFMEVTRRQFIKITSGSITAAVAEEASGLGIDTSMAQVRAQSVPIKSGKEVPKVCPSLPSMQIMEV
jgi:hypothetical protein